MKKIKYILLIITLLIIHTYADNENNKISLGFVISENIPDYDFYVKKVEHIICKK